METFGLIFAIILEGLIVVYLCKSGKTKNNELKKLSKSNNMRNLLK